MRSGDSYGITHIKRFEPDPIENEPCSGFLLGGCYRVVVEFLTGFDVRLLGIGLLKLGDGAERHTEHPAHVALELEQVVALAGIATEVEEHGELRLHDRVGDPLQ
ncbi:hypothetical protein BN381_180034 [Candidatus Microthrix parvicella RN1]|uniref:Uncharacterized protein n=1 Tax=Candidatus Neomicrothrix parvicella RN1 TaxID=1229780 RepID=R4Z3J5_9ACTN|nr:hypothetical protein BN381_180034 [Candidatus Microthrix parvicella RN1]